MLPRSCWGTWSLFRHGCRRVAGTAWAWTVPSRVYWSTLNLSRQHFSAPLWTQRLAAAHKRYSFPRFIREFLVLVTTGVSWWPYHCGGWEQYSALWAPHECLSPFLHLQGRFLRWVQDVAALSSTVSNSSALGRRSLAHFSDNLATVHQN